jgi:hypothetical protein
MKLANWRVSLLTWLVDLSCVYGELHSALLSHVLHTDAYNERIMLRECLHVCVFQLRNYADFGFWWHLYWGVYINLNVSISNSRQWPVKQNINRLTFRPLSRFCLEKLIVTQVAIRFLACYLARISIILLPRAWNWTDILSLPPSYAWLSQVISVLQPFRLNFSFMHFSSLAHILHGPAYLVLSGIFYYIDPLKICDLFLHLFLCAEYLTKHKKK